MILPEIMRCCFETIYHESQKKYTRLTVKALTFPNRIELGQIKDFRNLHLGSRDMTIFGEWVLSEEPKFDKNAHNF